MKDDYRARSSFAFILQASKRVEQRVDVMPLRARIDHRHAQHAEVEDVGDLHLPVRQQVGVVGIGQLARGGAGPPSAAVDPDDAMPAQGRFNAGQKMFWKVMFWCTFILLFTGIVMWFPEMMPSGLHWLLTLFVFIHAVTALVTIAAFIIHVYMSVWMTPGSMQAMTDGTVSSRFAQAHHRLWYEKVTGRK